MVYPRFCDRPFEIIIRLAVGQLGATVQYKQKWSSLFGRNSGKIAYSICNLTSVIYFVGIPLDVRIETPTEEQFEPVLCLGLFLELFRAFDLFAIPFLNFK